MKRTVVKVKVDGFSLLQEAIEYAAQRACDRCDKYSEVSLTETQRSLLEREFEASFWLGVEDRYLTFDFTGSEARRARKAGGSSRGSR